MFKRLKFRCHAIWHFVKNWLTRKSDPLFKRGTHIITGYMGSGKTLLANKVINSVDPKKFFFITNVDEFKQENVYYHNIWELFSDTKQIKKLPTVDEKGRKLYGLILDEINLKFNKRLNRSTNYNNLFVGLIEMIITSRHQGINRIYFIGQKLELQDTQLQSLFKYWHNILYTSKKAWWPFYKLENRFVVAPKKIFYETYKKGEQDEFEHLSIDKIKIKYKDLITYDTFGMRKDYEQLPVQVRYKYTQEHREEVKKGKENK